MKKLPLKTEQFRYVEKSFGEWLDILGYAEKTVYNMPHHVREMLHYFESIGITKITGIDNKHIRNYYQKLKERSNQRTGGGLGNNYLNKHLQAIGKFSDYLRQAGRITLPSLYMRWEEPDARIPEILTIEEIQQLYKSTQGYYEGNYLEKLNHRDRAMLSIFYGCGLRANEGRNLDISDILFDRQLIYVRKGKGYKQRYVPTSKANLNYIEDYIYNSRPKFCHDSKEEALFISQKGRRMTAHMMNIRLKLLKHRTDDPVLQSKDLTLHILRHSIATHLLQAGMKFEHIAKFLGHSSLASTQIYTHIIEQEEKKYETQHR